MREDHPDAESVTRRSALTRVTVEPHGRPLRIGIISPYSLSVPGGVQAQVLGLARELRRQGHEARVLGPCDGPPPEPFVTPLGNSLPTAANGSIAPLAPDASAALRTMRALRDEQFDVLHVHEPLAPGPPMTTLVMGGAPIVGTFHAAGVSTSYRVFKPVLDRLLRRIDVKVVVSKDAQELVASHFPKHADGIRMLFNGVDIATIATAPRCRRPARRSSSAAVTSNARGSPCSSRRSPSCPPTPGCGSGATVPTGQPCVPASPATPGSPGSDGSTTRRSSAGWAAPPCSARRRCMGSRSASC